MSGYGRSHGRRTDRAGSFRKEPPASQSRSPTELLAVDMAKNKQQFAEANRRRREERAFKLYEQEHTPIERGCRQERLVRKLNGTGGFERYLDQAMQKKAAEAQVRAARVKKPSHFLRVHRHGLGLFRHTHRAE